jgi:hypothetical protein
LEVLALQYPQRNTRDIEAGIDQTIFFPTKTRVNGRSISFLVPSSFIGKSDGSDWAVTAFVTAAERSAGMKLSIVSGNEKKPLEEFTLGVLQPQPGHPRDAVGYGSGSKPSPIFDLLTRSASQQAALLASGADLTGVSWGPHAGNDLAASAVAQVEAPAVPAVQAQGTGKKAFLSGPLDYLAGMFSSGGPSVASPVTPAPVQVLLDPLSASAKAQTAIVPPVIAATPVPQSTPLMTPAPTPTATPTATSIASRLQSLQQLFESKVITETEYKQQRQRILSEL